MRGQAARETPLSLSLSLSLSYSVCLSVSLCVRLRDRSLLSLSVHYGDTAYRDLAVFLTKLRSEDIQIHIHRCIWGLPFYNIRHIYIHDHVF